MKTSKPLCVTFFRKSKSWHKINPNTCRTIQTNVLTKLKTPKSKIKNAHAKLEMLRVSAWISADLDSEDCKTYKLMLTGCAATENNE